MTARAYAITKDVEGAFDDVVERVREALSNEGFGVLSTIDIKKALKEKLDHDIEPYLILGACNPSLARKGLEIEPDLGVLLPCNVVVRTQDGAVRVAAMEPTAALHLAENPGLEQLANEARDRISRAVASL